MKNIFLAAGAALALAGGAVLAQPADSGNTVTIQVPHPERGGVIYGNSGWTPDQVWGGNDNQAYNQQRRYGAIAGAPWGFDRGNYRYPVTRNDRDGDGVSNRRDRHPDNPRRR